MLSEKYNNTTLFLYSYRIACRTKAPLLFSPLVLLIFPQNRQLLQRTSVPFILIEAHIASCLPGG